MSSCPDYACISQLLSVSCICGNGHDANKIAIEIKRENLPLLHHGRASRGR